jgi:hypothetical protein
MLANVEALAKLQAACLAADSPCAPVSPDLNLNAASYAALVITRRCGRLAGLRKGALGQAVPSAPG